MTVKEDTILEADIQDAKERLDFARFDGDKLKIDLATDVLNTLLERYHACHSCHGSQTETQ